MSAAAGATNRAGEAWRGLSRRTKLLISMGGFLLLAIILGAAFGSAGENEEFQPQEEFRLEPWIPIHIGDLDLSFNKGVLYVLLATVATIWTMLYIANRMQAKPNRVQTTLEVSYDLARNNLTGGNMDPAMAARWFPFVATLFFFIWWSNMIGFIPLPVNSEETVTILGAEVPSLAIYAATANISVPLILTLIVWFGYHVAGIRRKGFVPYLRSWVPPGVEGGAVVPLFVIEVISHFVRIISLSVRLFANMLAGHLLILFMGGGLVVLLGIAALGVFTLPLAVAFYLFEVGLVVTLQAFIFAILTAIYLGGATAEHH